MTDDFSERIDPIYFTHSSNECAMQSAIFQSANIPIKHRGIHDALGGDFHCAEEFVQIDILIDSKTISVMPSTIQCMILYD